MKNVKINLDRPPIDSKQIQAQKDFNGLMQNHAIMSKPFYKSPWFFGASGLAGVGIVVGIVAYNYNDVVPDDNQVNTQSPPEITVSDNQLIAFNSDLTPKTTTENLTDESYNYSDHNLNTLDDNTNTLEEDNIIPDNNDSQIIEEDDNVNIVTHEEKHDEVKEEMDFASLMPRISGKANGSITKEELFDNKGITTESDVNVIHFELHLIDGLGGKVFEEESNQLNDEMKDALKRITSGETIYFENIKGKTDKGDVVRLNPLRYVLMN